MVRIKICGITSLEDALASVRLGADALGFVFAPSPRQVSPDQARTIIRRLPPLATAVGVFVDAPSDWIERVRKYCGLGAVQLHGSESEEAVEGLGGRVIKAIRLAEGQPPDIDAYPTATLLLDTLSAKAVGGTGQAFDWRLAVKPAKKRPIILAGGLNPENVAQAINIVHPYAVDVSSGVESKPGRKDHDQLSAFISRVKAL